MCYNLVDVTKDLNKREEGLQIFHQTLFFRVDMGQNQTTRREWKRFTGDYPVTERVSRSQPSWDAYASGNLREHQRHSHHTPISNHL